METNRLVEKIIQLTQQIDIVLNQQQLRQDQNLQQDKIEQLIDDSRTAVDQFVAAFVGEVMRNSPNREEALRQIDDFIKSAHQIGGAESANYLEEAIEGQLAKQKPASSRWNRFRKYGWIVDLIFFASLFGWVFWTHGSYKANDLSQPLLTRAGIENILRLESRLKPDDRHNRSDGVQPSLRFSAAEEQYYRGYLVMLSRIGYELQQSGHACGIDNWVRARSHKYEEEDFLQLRETTPALAPALEAKLSALPTAASAEEVLVWVAGVIAEQFPCTVEAGE